MEQISVLIASDSFKGSVSSIGVADLVELGVRRVAPDARVTKLAIARVLRARLPWRPPER